MPFPQSTHDFLVNPSSPNTWPEDPYVCAPNDQVEMVQVPQWEEAPPAVVGEATLVSGMENQ